MSLPLPAEDPVPENLAHGHGAHRARDVVDRPVLQVSGPAQIVQLVPYILGFHAHDSLVLIAVRGRRVVASARNDLDAPIELVEPWCTAAVRAGADAVVGAVYTDGVTGVPLPRLDYAGELIGLLGNRGLRIIDLLAVSDGRWWSYQCAEPSCCSPDGTLVDDSGPIAATAVSEGLVALGSRDDLCAELAPDQLATNLVRAEVTKRGGQAQAALTDPGVAQAVEELIEEGTDGKEWEAARRRVRASNWALVRRFVKHAPSDPGITPEMAAALLIALDDKHVRDATLGHLVDRPDPAVRDAWRRLTTMSPGTLRAAPATLYAMWCFAAGDGARSNVGVDAALEADPDYTLAHLILELQMTGLNPFEVVHDLGIEAVRVGRRIERRRPPAGRKKRKRT